MKNQKMQIKWNSNISGIYAWENQINGKMYIGKATNIYRRVYEEMNGFHNNRHQNLKKLYNAVKKYGINNFYVIKLLECPKEFLCKIEKLLINYYDSKNNGYNITFGGEGTLGHKVSKEQIDKQKKTLKQYWTDERKKHHSEKMKRWINSQPDDIKKQMKSGNNWWLNKDLKKLHLEKCRLSLTKNRIEKQKLSILKYYEKNVSKKAIIVSVINPTNDVIKIVGAYKFCVDNHISYKNFSKMIKGELNEYKGWRLPK